MFYSFSPALREPISPQLSSFHIHPVSPVYLTWRSLILLISSVLPGILIHKYISHATVVCHTPGLGLLMNYILSENLSVQNGHSRFSPGKINTTGVPQPVVCDSKELEFSSTTVWRSWVLHYTKFVWLERRMNSWTPSKPTDPSPP